MSWETKTQRGPKKRFSAQLHKSNDAMAVKALLDWKGEGWRQNPDKYGPDVLGPYGQHAEVEIKQHWRDGEHGIIFPYETVDIPARKAKPEWIKLRIKYYILSKELGFAAELARNLLRSEYLEKKWNKYMRCGQEKFYRIPVGKCKFYELEADK